MKGMCEKKLWVLLISGFVFSVQPCHADVITDWNVTGMDASAQTNVLVQSRALAITHAAVFDAVNAIAGKYKAYLVEVKAPAGASQEAAASRVGPCRVELAVARSEGDARCCADQFAGQDARWRREGRRCCSR